MALRLKEARTRVGLTQAAVAKLLGTTQQTYQRWEQGNSEPSIEQLQELARVLGTTPMMLMAPREVDHGREESIRELCENSELFWGHVGFRLRDQPGTFYYPVTEESLHQLNHLIAMDLGQDALLSVITLADKEVYFRPSGLVRLHVVNEACDYPDDDDGDAAGLIGGESGYSRELFRAMVALVRARYVERDLTEAIAPELLAAAEAALWDEDLQSDAEEAYDRLTQTRVWLVDGTLHAFSASEESLLDAVAFIDNGGGTFLTFEDASEGSVVMFPYAQVAMIEMPMHQLDAAAAMLEQDAVSELSALFSVKKREGGD